MKDIHQFLASGIIELYCLGLASDAEVEQVERLSGIFPEVQREIDRTNETLEEYARIQSIAPPPDLKSRILQSINVQQHKQDKANILESFIELEDYPEPGFWREKVAHIDPPTHYFEIYNQPLFRDAKHYLAVVWINTEVPSERHDDLQEKILILEGSCNCLLDDKWHSFTAGDLVTVPVNKDHNLVVTSDHPVKLILSRVKLAG